ncbi:MAG: response regulator transcription factor [Phyllobacteriaceae bacterium]|nr:response regulator transcription factor [Phyllobacteriaceae bacterium]
MHHFLVVDDHPLFREAIQLAVRSVSPKAEIHEATTIEAAVEMIAGRRRGYDLALLDLSLPGTSGFDGLLLLRTRFPRLPILVVSAHDDPRIVREAMSHGVSGFVSKAAKKGEIARAIGQVLAGGVYVPDWFDKAPRAAPTGFADGELVARLSSLTPQQMRVLQMLRQGLLNKQIAHELDVGETTVKAHVSEILRKLGVFSRTQAVIEAAKIDFDRFSESDGLLEASRR